MTDLPKFYPGAVISDRTRLEMNEDTFIGSMAFVSVPVLKMAKGSQINAGAKLVGRGTVSLGPYAVVSYDALLLTSSDTPYGNMADAIPEDMRCIVTGDITIGAHAFVSAKTVICPGVSIGERSFIGIGCVIKKDVGSGEHITLKDGTLYYDQRRMKRPIWGCIYDKD